MNEVEFSEFIDCNFPYEDVCAAEALIVCAQSLSMSSMFQVLEEICRPPSGAASSKAVLFDLIDIWCTHSSHPLAETAVQAARTLVSTSSYSVSETIALMEEIAQFPDLYSALNIVYYCCDDVDGLADLKAEEIRLTWTRLRLMR